MNTQQVSKRRMIALIVWVVGFGSQFEYHLQVAQGYTVRCVTLKLMIMSITRTIIDT
jgi:hypothetical protein